MILNTAQVVFSPCVTVDGFYLSHIMSIDVLKQELASLAEGERSQMVAYLLSLQDEKDATYRAALARKIDDRDPRRWIDLEELDRRLTKKK